MVLVKPMPIVHAQLTAGPNDPNWTSNPGLITELWLFPFAQVIYNFCPSRKTYPQ